MTVTRTPACTVRGCPRPSDPDFHIPICGHGLEGHHHHVIKRSQGGKDGPQVFICPSCHNQIDNGEWGNSIDETFEDGKKVTMYRVWDVHNKTIIEQVIGIDGVLSDGAEAGIAPPQGADEAPTSTPSAPSLSTKEESDGEPEARNLTRVAPGAGDSAPDIRNLGVLTHEQRVDITRHIKDAKQRHPFFAGDTANLWEEQLNDEFWSRYADGFGYTYPSLRNVMRVCKRIPPPQRHPGLSFAHHDVMDGHDIETREAWLERSFEEEWPVKRLREELVAEGLLTAKPRVKRWSLEELGDKFREWQHEGFREHEDSCEACSSFGEFRTWLEA